MKVQILLLAVMIASPLVCRAQQLIDANSSVIINNSDYEIHYELKTDLTTDWTPMSLDPGYKQTYKINTDGNLQIRVCTSDGQGGQICVSYRLERMKRYQLYWNGRDKRWDVAEIDLE